MTTLPQLPCPALVTVARDGCVLRLAEYLPFDLLTLTECQIEAFDQFALDHAMGAPLMIPSTIEDAACAVYQLPRAPVFEDDAVIGLAITTIGSQVACMRPAAVSLTPINRPEKDFLAALRASWWRFPGEHLIEIDVATVARDCAMGRHAPPFETAQQMAAALADLGIRDGGRQTRAAAERRANIAHFEGLDLGRIEDGARSFTRRIAGQILGTPATIEGLVL